MKNQQKATELAVRNETAEIIGKVMTGNRGLIPDRYYHNVSHWKRGDRTNPLEYVVHCLLSLPTDAAGVLLTYLESKYMARLSDVVADGQKLRMAEQEADNEEDMAELLAAANERDELLHYDRLLRYAGPYRAMVAHYAKKYGPRPMAGTVAPWRQTEKRTA